MSEFGAEFSSNSAYFIAGGRTLELIKKLEADIKNSKALMKKLARDYGVKEVLGNGFYAAFYADHEINNPALKLQERSQSVEGGLTHYQYKIDRKTPEGLALLARLEDIPGEFGDMNYSLFAKRLTGAESVLTNPDELDNREGSSNYGHFKRKNEVRAAIYRKYGDTYVVEVPRTIRGVFNEVSDEMKALEQYRGKTATGYRYDWFTPADSTPIPYSKAIELKEKSMGEQTKPREVAKILHSVASFPGT